MLNVRYATDSKARRFKPANTKLHSIRGYDGIGLLAQMVDKPANIKHALRDLGLELRFAGENDNWFDGLARQEVEEAYHRADVPFVLQYRILEPELAPE